MTIFESYKLTEFNTLYEIPVYRLSPRAFKKELEQKLDKMGTSTAVFKQLFPKDYQERRKAQKAELELHIAYPWKFNEIVGWVSLNIDCDIFSGELFYKDAKRIGKGSKSKILYQGEAFRFTVNDHMTNNDIYAKVLGELKELTGKAFNKKRFIDTHRFETVGKYIDWRKLFADIDASPE